VKFGQKRRARAREPERSGQQKEQRARDDHAGPIENPRQVLRIPRLEHAREPAVVSALD
jgi:hypothetical protein